MTDIVDGGGAAADAESTVGDSEVRAAAAAANGDGGIANAALLG